MAAPNAGGHGGRPGYVPVPPQREPWWRKMFPQRQPRNETARKRSQLEVIVSYVLALFEAVLIAWAGVIALLLLARNVLQPAAQTTSVIQAFCAAEMGQEYQSAYAHLSVDAVGQTSPQFVARSQQRDQRLGAVRGCAVTGENCIRELIDPFEADLIVQVTFAGEKTTQGTIGVHQYKTPEGHVYWAIFHIDPSLDLGPGPQS